MEPINITYRIKLDEKVTEVFDFALDGKTFELLADKMPNPPKWTELSFRQCSNCPLKPEEHPHCPLALQLHDIVERLQQTRSIDEVEVEIISEERRIIQTTALQRVIASMMGLVFPTCGCPKSAHMRPMARFHLPLASEEETVFRVTGMYLLAQYFLNNTGKKGQFDFDGLVKIYEDLHILNTAMASRLQAATRSDTTFNAVTLLDMYATLVPMLLEDQLVEMRAFFGAFLPAGYEEIKSKHNYLEKAKAFTLELVPIEEKKEEEENKPEAAKQTTGFNKESIAAKEKITQSPFLRTPPPKPQAPAVEKEAPVILEPLAFTLEPVAAEKPEEEKLLAAKTAGEKPPEKKPLENAAPDVIPADEKPIADKTEKKRAVFLLPDDEPPPPKPAAEKPEEKKSDEGGLMLVDYEP